MPERPLAKSADNPSPVSASRPDASPASDTTDHRNPAPSDGDGKNEEASPELPSDAPPLVWPLPEAEIDEWEVVPLDLPRAGHEPAPVQAAISDAARIVTAPAHVAATNVVTPASPAPPLAITSARSTGDPPDVAASRTLSVFATADPLSISRPDIVFPALAPREGVDSKPSRTDARPNATTPARGRSRPRLASVLAVVFALIAIGEAAYIALRTMATPAAPPETTVTLAVDSDPPGATVRLDDRLLGSTPVRTSVEPGRFLLRVEANGRTREVPIALDAGARVLHHFDLGPAPDEEPVDTTTGTLIVETSPPGATVVVAGRGRGVTPVRITGLAPGRHDVLLSASGRAITRAVDVFAGRVTTLSTSLVPAQATTGWVAIRAPIPLDVREGGRLLGTVANGQIVLTPGSHDLELSNAALGFTTFRQVQVTAGRTTELTVSVPDGTLDVNAVPWAEVFLDGRSLGETPLARVPVPIGEHELVFRHPQLGEQRRRVVVRQDVPTRVSISLRP